MSSRAPRKFSIRNQKGLLTLDFIFAGMLAFGFASILFSVSVMLSMVEIAQYITFATSRAYNGAHETQQLQTELAIAKYQEIRSSPVLKNLFGMGWMNLPAEPELGNFTKEYPEEKESNDVFVGARVSFDAKVLHLSVPFLGATASDSKVGKATLNSYLLREVSTEECRELFNRQRWDKLKALSGAYSQAQSQGGAYLITDNGC